VDQYYRDQKDHKDQKDTKHDEKVQ
jgi:hypothetical protein